MSSVLDLGDLAARVAAFGITTCTINGHDIVAIRQAAVSAEPDRALMILCHTSPYQGMPYLKRLFPRLHYVRFRSTEERLETQTALAAELGIDMTGL
jgi:transketolase